MLESKTISHGLVRLRVAAWVAVIGLSAIILAFPTAVEPTDSPVQSITIFENLPAFIALYYGWLSAVFFLLFSRPARSGLDWERMSLTVIFAVVFVGFWATRTPEVYPKLDGIWNAAVLRVIVRDGSVQPPFDLFYEQFPGMHFMAASTVSITGLGIFPSVTIMTVFQVMVMAALLYLLASWSLGNGVASTVAVLLMISANPAIILWANFWSGGFATNLLILLVAMLYRFGSFAPPEGVAWRAVAILVIGVIAFTHLGTALILLSIGTMAYLLGRYRSQVAVSGWAVALSALLPITWLIYSATGAFGELTELAANFSENLDEFLYYPLLYVKGTTGASLPIWVALLQYYWKIVTLAAGGLLGLWGLFRFSQLTRTEKVAIGGLLGLSLFFAAVSPFRGGSYLVRIEVYALIFTVPLLASFIGRLERHLSYACLAFLAVSLFVLSLPTFLAFNKNFADQTYYRAELAMGDFLEKNLDADQAGLRIYNDVHVLVPYHLPRIEIVNILGLGDPGTAQSAEEVWQSYRRLSASFLASSPKNGQAYWLSSLRGRFLYRYLQGIDSADPRWDSIETTLGTRSMIYSNGFAQLYASH